MSVRNIRRGFWLLLRLMVVTSVVFALLGGWAWLERSYIYPYDYRSYIEMSAARHHTDPYLVAALIKQLMPQTAAWIARQLGESFTKDDLYDPAFNIRYGVWYLAELEREFGGNDILALAAYNAGRGNVRDWMERWHWNNTFNEIEAIPYPETRLYVRRVLEDREQYKRLYEE